MIPPRIPEGGAILDDEAGNMEAYSDYMYRHRRSEYQNLARSILKSVPLPIGAKILEIGPGPAWITIFLAQSRPDLKITGVEASPDMIRVAEKNVQKFGCTTNIHFIQGTVEKLHEATTEKYDLIYSNDSLHHWIDPKQAIFEISQRLTERGKIFVHDSRRDFTFGGKLILHSIGKIMAGKMWKFWKSSIDASYTSSEIQEILTSIQLNWTVTNDMMDLTILC